jgi:hypothetical protein
MVAFEHKPEVAGDSRVRGSSNTDLEKCSIEVVKFDNIGNCSRHELVDTSIYHPKNLRPRLSCAGNNDHLRQI